MIPSELAQGLEGRYDAVRELGAGGMATVYLARNLKHDRAVAIKVLREELITTLQHDLISYPYAVCALDRGILIHRKAVDGDWGRQLSMERGAEKQKHRSLIVFFQTIRKSLLEQGRIDSNPFECALLNDLTWSTEFLRFGQGVVVPSAA